MSEKNYQLYAFGYGHGRRWDLLEAIELINGDDNENFYFIASDNDEDEKKNKARLELNRNKLSYNRAIRDIEANKLKIVSQDSFYASDKDFEYLVEPRIFIEWCVKNSINVAPKLMKYFNYQYWLEKEFWSFDETVSILLSVDCPPFPADIVNVFEKDEEHYQFAVKLRKFMVEPANLGTYYMKENDKISVVQFFYNNPRYDISKILLKKDHLFIGIRESGDKNFIIKARAVQDYSENLALIKEEKEDSLKSFLDHIIENGGEAYYNNFLLTPPQESEITTVEDCLDIFCGKAYISSLLSNKDFLEYIYNSNRIHSCNLWWLVKRYENRQAYEELFFRDFENGKIDFLIDETVDKEHRIIDGKVILKDFLIWADKRHIKPFTRQDNKILMAKNAEDRLIEFVGKRRVGDQKYTEVDNQNDRMEIGTRNTQEFESLIDGLELDGLINKGSTEVIGRFQRFRLELTNDGWKRFYELCNAKPIATNTMKQNTEDKNELELGGDRVILELAFERVRANWVVVKILDFRHNIKGDPVFSSKEIKEGSQHTDFITHLCEKFDEQDNLFIQIDFTKQKILSKDSRASRLPNDIGLSSEMRSLFFEGTISNKKVVFYKKITQKRLAEKGLENKI